MSNEDMIAWLDNAPYVELLYKWRFESVGSPWFNKPVGDHFAEVMVTKRPSDAEHTAISKQIGWDR